MKILWIDFRKEFSEFGFHQFYYKIIFLPRILTEKWWKICEIFDFSSLFLGSRGNNTPALQYTDLQIEILEPIKSQRVSMF